jgi:hypothetical protein
MTYTCVLKSNGAGFVPNEFRPEEGDDQEAVVVVRM